MRLIRKAVIRILIIGIGIALLIGGALVLDGYRLYKQATSQIPMTAKVSSLRNQPNYTPVTELPQIYLDAVVAVEDHAFYEHGPVDFSSIGRAIMVNLEDMSPREGGSTITQQVAKNIFFTQEKSFRRKIAEAIMAYHLEKVYSKDDILELYINTNYFGDAYTGVREASRGYFQKEPRDLTLSEATLLAGIPNAPSIYSLTKNPDLAKQRQKQVLTKMVEYGYLTQEEADGI